MDDPGRSNECKFLSDGFQTASKWNSVHARFRVKGHIWQAQPRWPILLNLLVSNCVLLPHSPHLLQDPSNPNRIHPMFPRLHLNHVSHLQQYYQYNRLPNCSSQQLSPPLTSPTSQHGPAGVAGVLKGKLILFQPHSPKSLNF